MILLFDWLTIWSGPAVRSSGSSSSSDWSSGSSFRSSSCICVFVIWYLYWIYLFKFADADADLFIEPYSGPSSGYQGRPVPGQVTPSRQGRQVVFFADSFDLSKLFWIYLFWQFNYLVLFYLWLDLVGAVLIQLLNGELELNWILAKLGLDQDQVKLSGRQASQAQGTRSGPDRVQASGSGQACQVLGSRSGQAAQVKLVQSRQVICSSVSGLCTGNRPLQASIVTDFHLLLTDQHRLNRLEPSSGVPGRQGRQVIVVSSWLVLVRTVHLWTSVRTGIHPSPWLWHRLPYLYQYFAPYYYLFIFNVFGIICCIFEANNCLF